MVDLCKNEGVRDRIVRAIVAIALAVVTYFSPVEFWWKIGLYIIAILILITSITGFCAFYRLLRINTAKN